MGSNDDRSPGGRSGQPVEDLTTDLLRFTAALVTLVAAVALGLFV